MRGTQSLEQVRAGAGTGTETHSFFIAQPRHTDGCTKRARFPAHVKASVALLMSLSSSDQTVFGFRLSVRAGDTVVLGREKITHGEPGDDVTTGSGRSGPDVCLMLFDVGKGEKNGLKPMCACCL